MYAFYKKASNYSDFEIISSKHNTISKKGGELTAPNTIKFLLDRIEEVFLFDDYAHYLPSIDLARRSEKKQRRSRTFAMLKILCTIVKMTDIKTRKIGTFNAARQWRDVTIERISQLANVSLSNTKKILCILKTAGIIETRQLISSSDYKSGLFKISVKKLSDNFISAMGLSDQLKSDAEFKEKEEQEISLLENKLPEHLRRNSTPAAKLLKTTFELIQREKRKPARPNTP